jgi:iron complex outermembrane receptor protein
MLKAFMGKCSLTAVACSLSLSAFAIAATPESLDVPAGELVAALKELARQSNVELLYQPEQLKGL